MPRRCISRNMLISAAVAALAVAVSWLPTAQAADSLDVDFLLAEGHCSGCDLSGAFLDAVMAEDGDLSFANLTGASLYTAHLKMADLSGADLSGADIKRVNLTGANLSDAILIGTDLTGADLSLTDTTGAITDTNEQTICPDGSAGPCQF